MKLIKNLTELKKVIPESLREKHVERALRLKAEIHYLGSLESPQCVVFTTPRGEDVYINFFYVWPDYRGNRISYKVLEFLAKDGQRAGMKKDGTKTGAAYIDALGSIQTDSTESVHWWKPRAREALDK
jgi:GNAT superfamily N-acetyltransferase